MNNYLKILDYLKQYYGDGQYYEFELLLENLDKKDIKNIAEGLKKDELIDIDYRTGRSTFTITYHGDPSYLPPKYIPFKGRLTLKGFTHINSAQNNSVSKFNPINLSQSKMDIQNLIAEGEIGKSLTLLLSYFKDVGNNEARNEAILFNSQFSQIKRQEKLNTISHEDANRLKSNITMALIELIDENL